MGVPGRPFWMTCNSSASGTMVKNSGSFSGGAGPQHFVLDGYPRTAAQ